jgi:Uncharacterized conserved protein
MDKQNTRRLNIKLIIYGICVVAIVLISAAGIFLSRKEYYIHTCQFSEADVEIVDVLYEKEGVVKVTDGYTDERDETIFSVEAIGSGETDVSIKYRLLFEDEPSYEFVYEGKFKVNSFGAIIDKSIYVGININKIEYLTFGLLAILILSTVFMLWQFIESARAANFNYTMIACGGTSLFSGLLTLMILYKYLNNAIINIMELLDLISIAGIYLMTLLVPVMFVMSIFLAVSNIWLIKHEGKRPVNTLGIIFGFLCLIATISVFFPNIIGLKDYKNEVFIQRVIVYIYCYFECMFISTVVCSLMAVRHKPSYDMNYIIILGCCIRKDGSLTPLLKGRVDSAVAFEKEQFEKTGKHAVFVPSGGQGPDEVIAEAEAMKRYLISCDIPENRILMDDKSENTLQNMDFSKSVIDADCKNINDKKVAFSTTNYHIFRGYILSKKCGFRAEGISAKTKAYFYPNAFLREFLGLIYDKRWNNLINLIIILGISLLFYYYIM